MAFALMRVTFLGKCEHAKTDLMCKVATDCSAHTNVNTEHFVIPLSSNKTP